MKVKELFFFSHGIRATFPTTHNSGDIPFFRQFTFLPPRTFSDNPSPANLLRRTFSVRPSPVALLLWTFSYGPSPMDILPTDLLRHTNFGRPSPTYLLPRTFSIGPFSNILFPTVYLQALFWSHQLTVQSILATHFMIMFHSDHINLPCSQSWRLFQ